MALLPVSTDYTDKDFDSLRTRIFALLRTVFPEWTDQNIANFGNVLVECFCFVGDVLAYYIDAGARESRITTATQRKSLLGLCKLLNYVPAGATAATANVLCSVSSAAAGDILIPAGTICQTADVSSAVSFQLLADVTIPTGATSVAGIVENSANTQETFTSTGLGDQECLLGSTPYLDDSAIVVADDGAYSQVTNFLSSTSTSRHFVVVVDQNDRARVRFGDGATGKVPVGTIVIDYKTGGGSAGNVSAGAINRISGTFTDGITSVAVRVTNPAKASGGNDRQTNESIRQAAPESLRALTRCVTKDDFEVVARATSGVARALMATSNIDPAIAENTGILYVVPTGGGDPSSLLKSNVLTAVTVTYPCMLTFQVSVQAPLYRVVDVQAVVYFRQGASKTAVRAAIVENLTTFFAVSNADGTINTAIDFGANLLDSNGDPLAGVAWSDVHDVVRDTSGVRKVSAISGLLLNNAEADISLLYNEFPVLGNVTVIDGDTGGVVT